MAPSADFYEAIVEALVSESAPEVPADVHRSGIVSAAAFARDQVGALTADLRWPLVAGLATFDLLIRLKYFRRFGALPLERRRRILRSWAFGPVPIVRQLFRPVRTTALVAYYETIGSAGRHT